VARGQGRGLALEVGLKLGGIRRARKRLRPGHAVVEVHYREITVAADDGGHVVHRLER